MRAAFALLVAVIGTAGGCFLVPSPDDAWSDDYGRAPADARAPNSEAGAMCAGASSCVACCDHAFTESAGTTFLGIVYTCGCADLVCPSCGGDCTRPDPSDECLGCLALNASAQSRCTSTSNDCSAGTACHDYADCITGCEP